MKYSPWLLGGALAGVALSRSPRGRRSAEDAAWEMDRIASATGRRVEALLQSLKRQQRDLSQRERALEKAWDNWDWESLWADFEVVKESDYKFTQKFLSEYGDTGWETKGRSARGRKARKTHKGTYYFSTYREARNWGDDNDWPTHRIIEFDKGWAIQSGKSGNYAGPGERPRHWKGLKSRGRRADHPQCGMGGCKRPATWRSDKMLYCPWHGKERARTRGEHVRPMTPAELKYAAGVEGGAARGRRDHLVVGEEAKFSQRKLDQMWPGNLKGIKRWRGTVTDVLPEDGGGGGGGYLLRSEESPLMFAYDRNVVSAKSTTRKWPGNHYRGRKPRKK